MKILIPVLGFAPSGGYRVLSEFASQWVERGHDVVFLSPQGEAPPYFPTRARVLAVSTQGELQRPGEFVPEIRFRGLRKLQALYAGVRRIGEDYDVVLANHSLTPWPIWLSRRRGPALVYYIQAFEPEYFVEQRAPFKWLLARLSYYLPFTQVANSAIYESHLGVRPQAIVPPGVDGAVFHPGEERRDFGNGAPIFLGCIGRREEVKGTRFALDAFTTLAASNSAIHMRVAYGNLPDGWSHPRCEVILPRDDNELAEFYRSIDIMIAPGTVQHGAPHYPVMEAMACGKPVVTTGYLPSTPENSWLVANRDAAAIADAVNSIINDSDYLSRVALASEAMRDLDWAITASRMLELFAKASNRGRGRTIRP